MPIQRLHTNARMSQIVIHGNTVYLAGQVGEDMSAGIEQQTRETLDNIERLLRQAGTDKQHILSVTIYLKDIDADFAGMNAVWDQWLPEGVAQGLHERGWLFYEFATADAWRFMCTWNTTSEAIQALIEDVRQIIARSSA